MILPQQDYRMTRLSTLTKMHRGLDRSLDQLVGVSRRRGRLLTNWKQQADEIVQQSSRLSGLTADELKQRLLHVKSVYRRMRGDVPTKTCVEALSLIVEAAERSLGIRPYNVQLLAAIAIQHGNLAEMATGEGKTLTAAFPAILTAWSARPCHIVTANDYLAARDAETIAPLYAYCGVSTGWITVEMVPNERRNNYAKDIVYTTGKELLADFLRDRLSANGSWSAACWQIRRQLGTKDSLITQPLMRGIDTAIIDEADSVLIDEAVTPLIISQPQPNQELRDACRAAQRVADLFSAGRDYVVDRHYREIVLTKLGKAKLDELKLELSGLFGAQKSREEMIVTALLAREFYQRGRQFLIDDGKLIIVDEFTGRMMPGRSWRQGLHQAIEARENLPISDPNETLAQLSFQNFFRLFRKLSGLTGTAQETAPEFWDIYHLPVLVIPTHKPCQRQTLVTRFFTDQKSKWQAICTEIRDCIETGQPVLVGTKSVAASEELAAMLDARQIPYQLLNAIKHREEAGIIALAGQEGQVTIATNMAGRGADIKLGPDVAGLGGLHIILSELHDSKRIDRQLKGRCARQGDPGSVRTYISLDDSLLKENLPQPILKTYARWHFLHGQMNSVLKLLINQAQKVAQRKSCRQRKVVLAADELMSDALSFAAPGVLY